MKLLSFQHQEKTSFGAVEGDQIADLGALELNGLRSLKAIVAGHALAVAADNLSSAPGSRSKTSPTCRRSLIRERSFALASTTRTATRNTKMAAPTRPTRASSCGHRIR